jgi:tetratricopeptide (TPR) repeat protein
MLYNNRGFTRLTLRQLDLAITDLRTAHGLCPEEIMPLVSLGEYHLLKEEYDEALQYLHRALSIPDGSEYAMGSGYYARGKAYLHKREFVKALADLQQAVEILPSEPEIWEHIAITAFRMEKFCDALQYFRIAISKDGGNEPKKAPNAAYYIGIIHEIVVKGCP